MAELWIVNPCDKPYRKRGSTQKKRKAKGQNKRSNRKSHGGVSMAKKRTPKRGKGGRFVKGGRRASTRRGGGRKKTTRRSGGRTRVVHKVVYRNPKKGPLDFLGLGNVDLMDVAGGTAISIGSRLVPSFLTNVVKLPTQGVPGYLVQLGSGLGLAYVAENMLKMKGMARMGRLFTLSNVLTRLADDLIFKGETIGSLLGLDYPPDAYVTAPIYETEKMLGQFPWDQPNAYAGGLAGQYTPGPEIERFQSRF